MDKNASKQLKEAMGSIISGVRNLEKIYKARIKELEEEIKYWNQPAGHSKGLEKKK